MSCLNLFSIMYTKEFTLRNKNSARPIQTLTADVLKTFIESRPESVSLVLCKYKYDYKTLTGKDVTLDFDQQQILKEYVGTNKRGYWVSKYSGLDETYTKIINCFQDGFLKRTISNGLLNDLALVERFFDMIDLTLNRT